MSYVMAPANGGEERRRDERSGEPERRARARRNALLLGLLAAVLYIGFILLGSLKGFSPG